MPLFSFVFLQNCLNDKVCLVGYLFKDFNHRFGCIKPIRLTGRFLSSRAFSFSTSLSSFCLIFHILCVYLHRQAKARGRPQLPPVASRFDGYFLHHYLAVFDNDYNFNLHRFLSNWLVFSYSFKGFRNPLL